MAELNLGRVVGQDGERGEPGKSAYAYAQEAGFVGTEQEFSSNLAGINEKANKAPDAVEGNIATLDAEGNPTDSGKNLDEIGGKVPIVSSPPGDEKITFWLNTQVPLKDVPIIDPLEDIEHTVVSAMQYREQGTGETKTIPALSVKSAYQSAVEGGYTGTEEDFKSLLADVMPRSEIETQLLNKLGYAGITNDITDTPAEAPQEKRKSGIWLTDKSSVEGTPAGWNQIRNVLVRFCPDNITYSLDILSGYYNPGKIAFRIPGQDWYRLATVNRKGYGLPLMEGYANSGTYFANDTTVTVALYCYKSDKSVIAANSTITVLPEGYRPASKISFLGLCTNFTGGSSSRWPCYLFLSGDGVLQMSTIGTSGVEPKEIYASVTFAR